MKQFTHQFRQQNKQTKQYVQKSSFLFVVIVRIAPGRVAPMETALAWSEWLVLPGDPI